MRRLVLFACLATAVPALAQQYESESRVISGGEAQSAQTYDAETALKQAKGNPYAEAMILRDLAAKAQSEGNDKAAAQFLKQALSKKALSGFAAKEMQKELAVMLAAAEDYPAVIRELAPILASEKEPSPAAMKSMSTVCSSHPATARSGPASGSTWPAMRTQTASRLISCVRCGSTGTGSSTPSTGTCPSISLPFNRSPAN